MAVVEFELRGDLATVSNSVIDANFDELKNWLNGELAAYRTMVVTEDGMPAAKADRAKIRKIAERIDEQRKVVKKAYNTPLAAFEAKCKELTALCDEAAGALDGQIKAYEEARRAEKRETLKAYFDEKASDLIEKELVVWGDIFSPSWSNTSCSINKAKAEIDSAIEKIRSDVDAITSLHSPWEAAVINAYVQRHDLSAALKLNASYVARAEQIAAERKRLAEERNRAAGESKERMDAPEAAPPAEPHKEEVLVTDFRVWCTPSQLKALGQWLKANGIKYGRVPEKEAVN